MLLTLFVLGQLEPGEIKLDTKYQNSDGTPTMPAVQYQTVTLVPPKPTLGLPHKQTNKKHQKSKKQIKVKMEMNNSNFAPSQLNPTKYQRPDKQFNCVQCLQAFKSKQRLEKHIKTVHEGNTPFKCSICGNAFCNELSLKNHVACKHEGKKVYQG